MDHSTAPAKNNVPSGIAAKRRYIFGEFILFPADKSLLYKNTAVQLERKIVDFLIILIEARPALVTKSHLMEKLWPDNVVSDWSVARLVSDTRKYIEDDGKTQNVIKTIRGKGYAFVAPVDEIIEAYPNSRDDVNTETAVPEITMSENSLFPSNENTRTIRKYFLWSAIFLVFSLLVTTYILSDTHLVRRDLRVAQQQADVSHATQKHRSEVMLEIKKNLVLTKTAFLSQVQRRNELGIIMLAKNPQLESLSWEQRFKQYYPVITPPEKFIYDQIKSITLGPLFKGNSALHRLLQQHPEMYQEIELLFALNSHLEIWLNKYRQIFLKHEYMPLVYVGVEDGVPFPSSIDDLVADWLKQKREQKAALPG